MVRRADNDLRPPASRTEPEKPLAAEKHPQPESSPRTHGWRKELGQKGHPDEGLDAAAALVGSELVAALNADDGEALVERFAHVPPQLRGMVATPRGRAALVPLLGGFATRFLLMTTPLTPQQQQALSERFNDFMLFMGKSMPTQPVPPPPMPISAERQGQLAALIAQALTHPAFEGLADERGRTPAETARELFTASDVAELEARSPTRFAAAEGHAKTDERHTESPAAEQDAAAPTPTDATTAKPVHEGSPHALPTSVEGAQSQKGRGGRGRFSTWNPLGAFQDEDPQHLQKTDNWNRLVLSALLILALGAVLVMVLAFLAS